jgi:dynein heavy chain
LKALTVPETFKEMADLMAYMNDVKTVELPDLLSELEEASRRLAYLVHFSALDEENIKLNTITFTWPNRVIPILEKNDEIILKARRNNESNLKERRIKFMQDLEDFQRQVDELKEVGDVDEMPFYVKKVQALQKQLQMANDTIAVFNKEEQLFGWQATNYPLRKKITAELEPYQALYSTAVQFQKSYKRWLDGNLLELDAEHIEQEVENLKRDMFRVLGSLVQAAAPRNIAKQVMEKIEEFVTNIPLIRVVCNPGLRDRHWVEMSNVSGFDIKPDGTTSLRKMLKLNLEQHLQPFQTISGLKTSTCSFFIR